MSNETNEGSGSSGFVNNVQRWLTNFDVTAPRWIQSGSTAAEAPSESPPTAAAAVESAVDSAVDLPRNAKAADDPAALLDTSVSPSAQAKAFLVGGKQSVSKTVSFHRGRKSPRRLTSTANRYAARLRRKPVIKPSSACTATAADPPPPAPACQEPSTGDAWGPSWSVLASRMSRAFNFSASSTFLPAAPSAAAKTTTEVRSEVPTQAPSPKPAAALGFSFSPAGLLLPYHCGVAAVLQDFGYLTECTPVAGASAGALACACLVSGVRTESIFKALFAVQATVRVTGAAQMLQKAIHPLLKALLPEDVAERFNSRPAPASIAFTRVFPPKGCVVAQFKDKTDVIECLEASCNIPFYFAKWPTLQCRGFPCVDGYFASPRSAFGCPATGALRDVRVLPFTPESLHLKFPDGNHISPGLAKLDATLEYSTDGRFLKSMADYLYNQKPLVVSVPSPEATGAAAAAVAAAAVSAGEPQRARRLSYGDSTTPPDSPTFSDMSELDADPKVALRLLDVAARAESAAEVRRAESFRRMRHGDATVSSGLRSPERIAMAASFPGDRESPGNNSATSGEGGGGTAASSSSIHAAASHEGDKSSPASDEADAAAHDAVEECMKQLEELWDVPTTSPDIVSDTNGGLVGAASGDEPTIPPFGGAAEAPEDEAEKDEAEKDEAQKDDAERDDAKGTGGKSAGEDAAAASNGADDKTSGSREQQKVPLHKWTRHDLLKLALDAAAQDADVVTLYELGRADAFRWIHLEKLAGRRRF